MAPRKDMKTANNLDKCLESATGVAAGIKKENTNMHKAVKAALDRALKTDSADAQPAKDQAADAEAKDAELKDAEAAKDQAADAEPAKVDPQEDEAADDDKQEEASEADDSDGEKNAQGSEEPE